MKRNIIPLLSLVGQLGFIIALPAAGLGFGGAYLDTVLGTSPLFVFLGLGIALATSGVGVYRLIKDIEQQTQD